jgi:hypothetical protein
MLAQQVREVWRQPFGGFVVRGRIYNRAVVSSGMAGAPSFRGVAKGWAFDSLLKLVGAVGIEPTTFGLKGRCSTTELRP